MRHTAQLKVKRRYAKVYLASFRILGRYAGLALLRACFGEERLRSRAFAIHRKTADDIVMVLQSQKGLFIKLGQTLSVMSQILPEHLTKRLEHLQDAVPPQPFDQIRERILKDLGVAPEVLFRQIDALPLASASLAQVHVAFLHTGEKVAVKVQYPGIEEMTHQDLRVLRRVFGWFDFFFPKLNVLTMYQECEDILCEELDYKNEARNIEKMTQNFLNHERFVFPKVYPQFSSAKVLTLSFMEGVKITDRKQSEALSLDRHKLCEDILHFYCKQIFIDGFYHADPHPGNMLLTPKAQVAMLDFGAVATISPAMRQGMTDFVEGIIKRDSRILGQALKKMGFVARKSDDETLDTVVDYFYSKFSALKIENFKKLDVAAFHNLEDLVELKKLNVSFRELAGLFSVPKEWILLERTLLILSNLSAELDEDHNPMQTVIPYVETFLLGPNQNLSEWIAQAGKELVVAYLNLPNQLERALKKLNQGQLQIVLRGVNEELARSRKSTLLLHLTFLMLLTSAIAAGFATQGHREITHGFLAFGATLCVVFIVKVFRK